MPTPDCDEQTWEEFRDLCMEDEESVEDFPDEDQRFMFCASQWEEECGEDPLDEDTRAAIVALTVLKEK